MLSTQLQRRERRRFLSVRTNLQIFLQYLFQFLEDPQTKQDDKNENQQIETKTSSSTKSPVHSNASLHSSRPLARDAAPVPSEEKKATAQPTMAKSPQPEPLATEPMPNEEPSVAAEELVE